MATDAISEQRKTHTIQASVEQVLFARLGCDHEDQQMPCS